jgi:catechol 2,3-dioxygenase-like lactoylglutathione lyase family enzyme
MATPLDFIVFYVSDLQASLSYFTEKLGFIHESAEDGPLFRQLNDGGSRVGIGLVQAGEQTAVAGTSELYFKTADIAGLRDELIGKGLEATPIVQRPFGLIFTVHTPDGYRLTMLQTEPSS